MREQILDLIVVAVNKLNEELDYESLEGVRERTPIYGGVDSIDSLSLLSLITDIEERVKLEFGVSIILADEQALASAQSPYSNVGALLEFTLERLELDR